VHGRVLPCPNGFFVATPPERTRSWPIGPHGTNRQKALCRSIRQKGKKVKQHQLDGKIPLYKQEPPLLKRGHIKKMAASQGMRVQ
jgi:hypothetical protein